MVLLKFLIMFVIVLEKVFYVEPMAEVTLSHLPLSKVTTICKEKTQEWGTMLYSKGFGILIKCLEAICFIKVCTDAIKEL